MNDRKREQQHLVQAQQFDQETLAQLYDDYHVPLYRYIYRRVGHVETAQDLTADVFKRLLQALHQGQSPKKDVRAWLYRTAHNLVIDHYRRQQHRQHLPLYDGVVSSGDGPELTAELHIQADVLRAAIQELTPDQQQVITLKFLEGFKNQEVATVLNKPVGAVKSLQHRALAALQRQLLLMREEESI